MTCQRIWLNSLLGNAQRVRSNCCQHLGVGGLLRMEAAWKFPCFRQRRKRRKKDLLPCKTCSQEGSVLTDCCVQLNCMTLVTEVKIISSALGVNWEMIIHSKCC